MSTPAEATRATVTQMWQAVIDGTVSRDDAHRWAGQWVEGDDTEVGDLMVRSALQRLHGFDLVWTDKAHTKARHGGPGTHIHAVGEIQQTFTAWRAACENYDIDPAGYLRRVRKAARSAAARSATAPCGQAPASLRSEETEGLS
jgi:hypothetical protein